MDPSLFILAEEKIRFLIYEYNTDFSKEEKIKDIPIIHTPLKINSKIQDLLPPNLEYVYNLSLSISSIENHLQRTILDTIDDSLFSFLKTKNLNLQMWNPEFPHANIIHTTRNLIDKSLDLLSPDPSSILLVRFDEEPDRHVLGFPLSFVFNQVSYLLPISSSHLYLVCQGYSPENKKTVLTYIKKKSRKGTSRYNDYLEKTFSTKKVSPLFSDQNRLLTEWGVDNSIPEIKYHDILSLIRNYDNKQKDILSELEEHLINKVPIKKYFIHEENKEFSQILNPFFKKYNIQY